MNEKAIVSEWYISCYETIGVTCPFCGQDVCAQFSKIPPKCPKCGATFNVVIEARK